MDRGVPAQGPQRYAVASRVPLAVVMVDGDGLVSHWSTEARRLFGRAQEEAVGRPAGDLLPVAGALVDRGAQEPYASPTGPGPGPGSSLQGRTFRAIAGRARLSDLGSERIDVLWWAYPLVGPGDDRLLVLAADAQESGAAATRDGDMPHREGAAPEEPEPRGVIGRGGDDGATPEAQRAGAGGMERIAPGFGRHTEFAGSEELVRGLPEILRMGVEQSTRIVSRILDLGCPILEFGQQDRMPLTADWGVSQRVERSRAPRGRSARGGSRRPLGRGRPGQGPGARGGP